ncbi:MAG: hypothetical protein IIA88_04170 [Bacteroidetes bacterium]|nr:hypothetical protein [Bacteroidota bacterium]
MKQQTIFLLTLTILTSSCDNLNNKAKIRSDKGSTMEEIITNELSSGIRKDTIFLGFAFGMTENDFNKKLRELLKEEKIYKDKSNRNFLTYDLTVDQYNTFKCTFSPEYFDGKLFELGVSVNSKDQFSSVKNVTLQLFMFFMNKYGLPTVEQEMQLIEDCKEYIWINGNRKIKIMCGLSDSRIYYEDLSVTKEKEQIENKEINDKRQKSQTDI